jgi:DUF4097 and DUF4098 domain-containing protein YvlB
VLVETAWTDEIEVNLFASILDNDSADDVEHCLGSLPELRDSDGAVVIDINSLNVLSDLQGATLEAIEILMPEQYGLIVHTNGPIETRGKVEGDVALTSEKDNINADKIRGEHVNLSASAGTIVVKTLEGQDTSVSATNVEIAKMMGETIAITSTEGGIVTNAIYAMHATLRCGGAGGVTLGSMHGALDVETERGSIGVNGLNGSIDAQQQGEGKIAIHVDALTPGGVNRLTGSGDITVSASPDLQVRYSINRSAGTVLY